MGASTERRNGRSEQEENEIEENYSIDEYKAIAMAFFDVSYLEACRMTYYEFSLRMLAYDIKQMKEVEKISLQAWRNQQAKATKITGSGKNKKEISIYKDFNDFYNSKQSFNNIIYGETESQVNRKKLSLADRNRLLNKRKEGR